MTVIFNNKSDLSPSSTQLALGDTRVSATGNFSGASLIIESNPDGIGWVKAYAFTEPDTVILGFAAGESWRASLSNVSAGTSINLSALAK